MRTLKIFLLVSILQINVFSQNFWEHNDGPFSEAEVSDLYLTKSGILLANVEFEGLYYTTDSGESWTKTNYPGDGPYALETINDSIIIAGGIITHM